MTVKELYLALDARIPSSLSCDWDHDGLCVCPDENASVQKVLCVLDVTESVLLYAKREGFDTILSHHAIFFHPTYEITEAMPASRRTLFCIKNGISVMAFHTRADAVQGGVNSCLLDALSLTELPGLAENPYMRFGKLPSSISTKAFAALVKNVLGAPSVRYADAGKPVSTVAVCGGGGKDFFSDAKKLGADLYLSGELGHHVLLDAPSLGMSMLEAGHYETEYPVTAFFASLVSEINPSLSVSRLRDTPISAL